MTLQEYFFHSYNKACEAAYDEYFAARGKEMLKHGRDDIKELEMHIEKEIGKWSSTSLSELGGMTPLEYINKQDSLEALAEMFLMGAAICDDRLPDIFISRLRSFGKPAENMLLELCSRGMLSGEGSGLAAGDESSAVLNIAAAYLGEWKSTKAVEPLISLLDLKGEASDLLSETVRSSLVSIGASAIEPVIRASESEESSVEAKEHLIMALAEIGSSNKSDPIYRCLKDAFLKEPFKATAASCLAQYGDGRAIPALRGYIEKAGPNLDKITLYEIISAIRSLGGKTDDLVQTRPRGN